MKVLFVCSGNFPHYGDSNLGIVPIIKRQGDSLTKQGVEVNYFTIKGKGAKGYLKNIIPLRKEIKKNKYDIIHCHYYLTGIVAGLTGSKKVIVSLMGSDVYGKPVKKLIIKSFSKLFWKSTIVKSKAMSQLINIPCEVIPNGVDFDTFKPLDREECRKKLSLDINKKYILFVSNHNNPVKNYTLAKESVDLLKQDRIELLLVSKVSPNLIPLYINAGNVLLLTSHHEGSPNVIKEAMACNIPIVSTDVGDVKEVTSKVKGCFITSKNKKDISENILKALDYDRTYGRENIAHLEESIIANKLIRIYKSI